MANVANLINANTRRWAAMHFNTSRLHEFEVVAKSLIAQKAQYQAISDEILKQKGVRVPWAVIGVVDQREHEASLGLTNSYLGNGQPLDRVTTLVPAGRGPFFSHPTDPPLQGAFFRGALDALIDVQKIDQWVHAHGTSPGAWLTFLETLNGLGYADRGLASPYIWGGTSEQQPGKYVSDGVFDSSVWDSQLGCAGMLRFMSGLDPSVGFAAPIIAVPPTPVPVPVPTPVPTPKPVPTPGPIVMPDFAQLAKQLNLLMQIVAAAQAGNTAAIPKLIAAELYSIALAIDPTLKGT